MRQQTFKVSEHEVSGVLMDTRLAPPERGISCRRALLRNVDLSEQTLWYFGSQASVFEGCDFHGIVAEAGSLGSGRRRSVYRDCDFTGAHLAGINPGFTRFEHCIFDNAKIVEWFAFCAEFVSCRFKNAKIVGSKFVGGMDECAAMSTLRRIFPPKADFYDNDFRDAELIDTSFVLGVDLNRQMMPVGPEYIRLDRIGKRLREAKLRVLDWSEGPARDDALRMISVYEFDAADQDELFARRDELDSVDTGIRERVWALLSEV